MKKSYEFEVKLPNYNQIFLVQYEVMKSGTPVLVSVNYDSLPLEIPELDPTLMTHLKDAIENNWDTELHDYIIGLFARAAQSDSIIGKGSQVVVDKKDSLSTDELKISVLQMQKQMRENPKSMKELLGEELFADFESLKF